MATNNMRWQAPGNGKIFDDKLGSGIWSGSLIKK